MSSTYYQQFNAVNNNLDLINNQSYSHQLARACPLTLQQRSTNLQQATNLQTNLTSNLLTGHSLDALNTVGLSTAKKDVNIFKNPNTMHSTLTNGLSMDPSTTNALQTTAINQMSFTHRLLLNSAGQTGSTGQLNTLTNGLINGCNSEVDVRRLCLSEQQQLEFNLVQELEQKSKLNQQNQLNNEIVHSTPKSYGTLKKNKQSDNNTASLTRSSDSKVRNICAKLFGTSTSSSSNNSSNKQTTLTKQINNQANNQNKLNGHLTNSRLDSNQLINQPKSSKLLASAVTSLPQQQQNKSNLISQSTQQFKSLINEQSIEASSVDCPAANVIYAEIRKKQANNSEKIILNQSSSDICNQTNCIKSNTSMNAIKNCDTTCSSNNNSSFIDDKYVVVVDSSSVSTNSDHNTSNQSLTVKNSPINASSTGGILTTDLDQCNQNNSQEIKTEHLHTSKQDKCEEKIAGLESPTTSSSESGRGTLNGEQQLSSNGNNQNLRQTENNSTFDQTSVTSDDMKRLKTFKEEVLENWNHNKKLIAANCIVVESRSNDGQNALDSNNKIKADDKELKTFEQVQLKIQKLLNDDDAFTNDEDFDDLIASDAYQTYTAQTINCINSGKLDRLSVVNESDGSWLSDSTNANSVKNKLTSKSMSKQLSQSNQQLNLNNSQRSSNNQSSLQQSQNKQQLPKGQQESNKQQTDQQSPNLKRNHSTQQSQLPQSSTSNKLDATPIQLEQSPRSHHLHVHQSPKSIRPTNTTNKNVSKLNAKPISKLNGQQTKEDFATLISENSRRLNKLNKNQYKNRSMDDLTDLMDDLNSVYTETATMNYAAPTVVKKQLKGIESMYSEVRME